MTTPDAPNGFVAVPVPDQDELILALANARLSCMSEGCGAPSTCAARAVVTRFFPGVEFDDSRPTGHSPAPVPRYRHSYAYTPTGGVVDWSKREERR